MAGDTLSADASRARWEQLAEPARVAITAALIAAVDAELSRIDTFWPASYGDHPTVEVLGVDAQHHVRFLAHALNYNHAQSGSDWADHYVFIGDAALDGDRVGTIQLTLEVNANIREPDWEHYQSRPVVAEVRAKLVAALGAR